MRLYRGAQRLLALEEQVVARSPARRGRALRHVRDRRLDRPGRHRPRRSSSASSRSNTRSCTSRSRVFDTQTIVERVAARELELGVVGAAPRHRGVVFEPFFRDEVVLACPPGHRFAGRTVTLDELRRRELILMQEGAGVRQVIEDELRSRRAPGELDVRLELGLQESVVERRARRLRRHVHLALAIEADLAAGTSSRRASRASSPSARSGSCAPRAAPDARRARVRRVRARAARDRPLGSARAARGAREARDRAAVP